MSNVLTSALAEIVRASASPEEMKDRVVRSFGEAALPAARQLAAEIKGFDWLRNYRVASSRAKENDSEELKSDPENINPSANAKKPLVAFFYRKPEWLTVFFGQLLLLIAVFFPPFNAHLSEGVIVSIGFAFIFSPPGSGNFRATVDVPLLAVIVMSIFISTLACYSLVREIRRSSSLA